MTSAPEIKAAGFNSNIAALRGMVSAPAFDGFVAALPPECAALIRQPPLAVSWLPLAHVAPVHPVAFEHLFAREPAKMCELGRLQLRADMTGIYRLAMRIASPAYIAERTSKIYAMYARGCGTVRVVVDQPGRIDLLVEGRPLASSAFYHYLRGTMLGVIELTGVKRVSSTIAEGGGNTPRCLFRVTWS
jgi:hypothetical protein